MDTSKKQGLLIISGRLGMGNKTTDAGTLASVGGHGRVVQVELSGKAPEPLSSEDLPEYPHPWVPQSGVAHDTMTRIFIGGVPLEEHKRREALPRRRLAPADIPNEPWREWYAEYDLREDGTIISSNGSIDLGWVQIESGTVAWVRL